MTFTAKCGKIEVDIGGNLPLNNKQRQFLTVRTEVQTDEEALEQLGFSKDQLWTWRSRFPEFKEQHDLACTTAVLSIREQAKALMPKVIELIMHHCENTRNGPVSVKALELMARLAGALEGQREPAAKPAPLVAIQVNNRPYEVQGSDERIVIKQLNG